jgi:hypothetical protein
MKSVPWHKSVTYNSVPLNKKDVSRTRPNGLAGREAAKSAKER